MQIETLLDKFDAMFDTLRQNRKDHPESAEFYDGALITLGWAYEEALAIERSIVEGEDNGKVSL